MNESRNSEKKNDWWQFIKDGWKIFAAVIGLSWTVALIVADVYVTGIFDREYEKRVMAEPIIAAIRNDITAINGSLDELEGNDGEIRQTLSTVVTRLDTLISIQLAD